MVNKTDIFEAFNQLNILVIGDVMIDRYMTGQVERISPEAPVPVVHLYKREDRLGGAANVALNIKALGATPYLCSVIGKDRDATQMLQLLPDAGLSLKGIAQSKERVTTVKTRILAGSQQLLRVDEENTNDLSEKEAISLLEIVRNILEERTIHVILFQDYNKGVLSPEIIRAIMEEAIKRGIPTAVDPKFKNFWAYKHVTLFKPNLKEIRNQMPEPILAEAASLHKAAGFVREKLANQYTLITLSEKGLFIDDNGESLLEGTRPRQIADVSGAGDTVISVAALCLALSMDIQEIATLSNLAGGQVCERLGVVPVNKAQLQQEYEIYKKQKING
ncbi:MAG: PfkB family carbohydrate kinase [Saprospiraceae bacterium]|nr:PfkB family carbohydrate kinase [Saprospiraceae bacterium]